MDINAKKPYRMSLANDIDFTPKTCEFGGNDGKLQQQIEKTIARRMTILQEIQKGVFCLTIKKHDQIDQIQVKKLCDKTQYILLPSHHEQEPFGKISFNNFKNICHGLTSTIPFSQYAESCHLIVFYHLDLVEQIVLLKLEEQGFSLVEKLSNRTLIISNNTYHYPISMTKFPAVAIFTGQALETVITEEITALNKKFILSDKVYASLKKNIIASDWHLSDGKMLVTTNGLTQSFDYPSLIDDLIHMGLEDRIEEHLYQYDIGDLNLQNFFPTITVRSPAHLKARPDALAHVDKGFAIVAAKESVGKQIPIMAHHQGQKISSWLSRASRHLFRHRYKARVIFANNYRGAFSLVGEQIATIAMFPALIKGVFETLDMPAPKSVRLIAHNEDILTIAHDTASWVDINETNQKASLLFRMVSSDGSDPLSLFQQTALPDLGVGNFTLKIVHDNFFSLIESTTEPKKSIPKSNVHYLLGLAYDCIDEFGLAAQEFKKALRFDNADPEILHALGSALMETGNVKEALPFLKRAFALTPDNPEIANLWGKSSLTCGHVDEAIVAFEEAVRLSPGSPDFLKNLGEGYLLARRPEDALGALHKALRCDPSSAQTHVTLAFLHLNHGEDEQAKKHALLAYKEDPTDATIADLLWHLTLGKK